jgi:hypothetical protein
MVDQTSDSAIVDFQEIHASPIQVLVHPRTDDTSGLFRTNIDWVALENRYLMSGSEIREAHGSPVRRALLMAMRNQSRP